MYIGKFHGGEQNYITLDVVRGCGETTLTAPEAKLQATITAQGGVRPYRAVVAVPGLEDEILESTSLKSLWQHVTSIARSYRGSWVDGGYRV